MDRDRLKQVERADLNESRVNEDFLLWLKTKGLTWLFVGLLAISGYMFVVRYRQGQASHRTRAWTELTTSRQPNSLEDVANAYPEVDQVARIALMQAAQQLVGAVQSSQPLDALATDPLDPTAAVPVLSPEQRDQYLTRADGLYRRVLEGDDGSFGLALHMAGALNGLAAVAESRGDADAAREYYERAAKRLAADYPELAQQARRRRDNVAENLADIALPTRATVEARIKPPKPVRESPIQVDPTLQRIWEAGDDEGDSAS